MGTSKCDWRHGELIALEGPEWEFFASFMTLAFVFKRPKTSVGTNATERGDFVRAGEEYWLGRHGSARRIIHRTGEQFKSDITDG